MFANIIMATQFPVSYSAQAAMYSNRTASQSAGTYYIQGGPSDSAEVIEGNLRVTGNLQVDGNEVVGGSLAAASLAATGAVTGASVAATGAVTAASATVTGIINSGGLVTAGTVGCGAANVTAALTAATVNAGTGGMSVPNGAAYRSTAVLGNAPGVTGLTGTRQYQVSVPANAVNFDVGLNEIINDTVPHQLAVTIIGAGATPAPFASYGNIQSYPTATGQVPNLQTLATGNGYSWNQFGAAGTYNLGLNSGLGVVTTATVIITIIF